MRTPLRVVAGGRMERRTSGSARTVGQHRSRRFQQATLEQPRAHAHWSLRECPSLRGQGLAVVLCGGARVIGRLEPACRCYNIPGGLSTFWGRGIALGKRGRE